MPEPGQRQFLSDDVAAEHRAPFQHKTAIAGFGEISRGHEAVVTRTRNHNGYLLRWDAEGLLFDPGEGTQRQMLFAGVTASQITRICVTHFHGDVRRKFMKCVSSGMLPYQITRYWPNVR